MPPAPADVYFLAGQGGRNSSVGGRKDGVVRRQRVTQRADELLRIPAGDGILGWELRAVDVDDRGVGRAEFVDVVEGGRVDVLRQFQSVAAGLGQSDDLLQPGRAGRLDVQARAVPGDAAAKSIADAQKNGISYDAAVWTGLCGWADKLGVEVPASA